DNTMFVSKILSTFFGIQKAPVRFELKKGYIREDEMHKPANPWSGLKHLIRQVSRVHLLFLT
ncbi:MAG: hypothetical protein WCB17_00610, partial [Dehalococcoidales bacterium]